MRFIYVLVVVLASIGCSGVSPFASESKVVASKMQVVEAKFGGSQYYSDTVYYLVADDGSVTEVSLKTYVNTKAGDSVASTLWR